ncbi:MAG: serine hydrolase [Ignavibacteriales bacterium]|nr:serine hydrolase [Ignavibacteriales bacterium]
MKIFFYALCIVQLSLSQTDLLKDKFLHNLKEIVDNSDAVVGVAIKDLKSGEQVLINENEIFPQASSIKIHILAEVYRQAAEGKFKLSDIKQFPTPMRVGGSGILSMLGEKSVSMSIRDYCILMINLSDNSATNLLIDLVGMKNVNESLVKNGAPNTKLQRVMMDYQAAKEGRENISTPKDVLTILEKLYAGTLVNKQSCDDVLAIMKMGKGGSIKDGMPADVEIANKAGDVEGVRVDAGIVFLEGNPYIICVMTKMLLNESDGSKIIESISRETYNYLERKAHSNQYGRRIPK